ncbi:hypothetical protein [Synechococcus sp. UW140]|uniref:hypothetical protein n=1 Tax=Synechococcus sp. UW140 TaxID=368503 RepID=UPI00313800B5
MTKPVPTLEVLLMPLGAVELPEGLQWNSPRSLALAALKEVLARQKAPLPLGPSNGAVEEGRLLSLNRFALQLVTTGLAADQIVIDKSFWMQELTAPQLLLAAQVDEENDVVVFTGVLTGAEFISLVKSSKSSNQTILVDTSEFKGGVERLLTLVQLLEPAALPRFALATAASIVQRKVIAIADWINGQLDEAFSQSFGAQLQPLTESAFRTSVASRFENVANHNALALVSIPLGLANGKLISGQEAKACAEHFVLQMLATTSNSSSPDNLLLLLSAAIDGDLLPNDLCISACQGSHTQQQIAENNTKIEFNFSGGLELINVSLGYPGSNDLVLPPLQLPG